MLDSIRSRKRLIQIVLGFVILVFIAFYAGNFASVNNDRSGYVARIAKEHVSYVEYQNMLDVIQEQQKQFLQNREVNPQMMQFFRQQAVNTLVDRKMMLLEAKDAGIQASDEEVKRSILESPYFSSTGGFVGMEEYKRRVEYLFHMDIPSFEQMIAEDVVVRKYDNVLTAGILVSNAEVEDEFRNNNLTAKIDYVAFDGEELGKDISATPEEVRAYYDSHKNDFQSGELRKVQYLWISHDSEKNKVQVPESELKKYYETNVQRYSRPEQVKARHILLKTEGKDDAAVLKQAQELVSQLRAGADFAALARQYSEDPGSKENGGDLGMFERGRMVPEFEKTAFGQEVNQISDPVKTQFGYHIIQTTAKQPAYNMEFSLVKDQIYRELSLPKAMKNAEDQAKKIHDEITKNKKSLSDISKLQLVDLKTSDYFSQNQDIPGLGPAFRSAAFDLKKGDISEPVLVFQDYAILQLLDSKASAVQPFEKVEAQARQKVLEQKRADIAKVKAQEFYASLAGTTDLKAAAEKAKVEMKTSEDFAREGYIDGIGSVKEFNEKVFAMQKGQISEPVKAAQKYVVFQVKEKKEFDRVEFEKQKDSLRRQIKEQRENAFAQSYRDQLRKKYEKEIWINPDIITPKEA